MFCLKNIHQHGLNAICCGHIKHIVNYVHISANVSQLKSSSKNIFSIVIDKNNTGIDNDTLQVSVSWYL